MEQNEFTAMIPLARYVATSNGISITVEPAPLPHQSRPEERVYAFAYTVTIANEGAGMCRLVERHWWIFSAGKKIGEVIGPGVVGEKPVLRLGERFTYTSSAIINDPIGEMHGTYLFELEDGGYIEAEIPRFDLCYGEMLH